MRKRRKAAASSASNKGMMASAASAAFAGAFLFCCCVGVTDSGRTTKIIFRGKRNEESKGKKIFSATGNRTRACWVRASYPNH